MSAASEICASAEARGPAARARGPVAIVDIGSNSVRLVIYENQARNAATWQNEKAICGIGRDMVTTGRLHAEGCAAALEALARFRMIADGLHGRKPRGGGDGGGARRRQWRGIRRRAPNAPGVRPSGCWRAKTKRASPPKAWSPAFPKLGPGGRSGRRQPGHGDVKGGKTGDAWTLPFGPLRLMDQAKGDPDKRPRHRGQGPQEYSRHLGVRALCGGRHLA